MDLNRFIAEKVMGWTDVKFNPGGNMLTGQPDDDYNRDYQTNKHRTYVPKYSTDITHAFEVVERMRDLRYTLNCSWPHDGRCLVKFHPFACFNKSGRAHDKNIAKAICLAAKAALEDT